MRMESDRDECCGCGNVYDATEYTSLPGRTIPARHRQSQDVPSSTHRLPATRTLLSQRLHHQSQQHYHHCVRRHSLLSGRGWSAITGPLRMLLTPCWLLMLVVMLMMMAGGANAQSNLLQYSLLEEQYTNTLIANVAQDLPIADIFPAGSQVRYKFMTGPMIPVRVHNVTGLLTTSGRIDREEMCPGASECSIKLDMVAFTMPPHHDTQLFKVRIALTDLNDNSPHFPSPALGRDVLESASVGTSIAIQVAEDPDSPPYSVQKYMLVDSSNKFRLQVRGREDGGAPSVKLVLTETLDREKVDSYTMKVVASDGGSPAKSGSVDITVNVVDANDHAPVFDNVSYAVTIPENYPLQTTIIQVHASDPDDELNGEVVYTFSDLTKADYGHVFGINNRTGEIYIQGVVDFEENSLCHLMVIAQDRGPDSLPVDKTVTIRVRDLNDHSPQITVNTLSAAGTTKAFIAENSGSGSFVAHITVVDGDSGKNGQVNCTLNNQHFRMQHLYEAEYKIVTVTSLDRETRADYDLALECRDSGIPPQITVTHLSVVVSDVNDHIPVFIDGPYTSSLFENNYEGFDIVRVNATDEDAGANSEIVYELEGPKAHMFNIDSRRGIITAAVMFDREQDDSISVNVIARDRGDPPQFSKTQLVVTILDTNDVTPTFFPPGYQFGVHEGNPAGTYVGIVTATDADAPPFNDFSYSLVPSGNSLENFLVDPETGEITTRRVLDREFQPSYHLLVVASDRGLPPRASTATATVIVGDINDNRPVFDFPRYDNNTVHVSNLESVGYVVTRLRSHDMDTGNNAKVTYRIDGGNERGYFSLDPNLGTIQINMDLTERENEVFELMVTVRDHGYHSLESSQILRIVSNSSAELASTMTGHNVVIVITLACASGVVTVVLVIAIVIIRRQDSEKKTHKYNCRMEALKILAQNKDASRDSDDSAPGSADPGKKKKEVSFSLEVELDQKIEQSQNHTNKSWPSSIDPHHLQHPQACSSLLTTSTSSPPVGNSNHHPLPACPPPPPPARYNPNHHPGQVWPQEQRDMEVHHLLQLLKQQDVGDSHSDLSAEGSATDSGRGASEEAYPTAGHHQAQPRYHNSHQPGHQQTYHRHANSRDHDDNTEMVALQPQTTPCEESFDLAQVVPNQSFASTNNQSFGSFHNSSITGMPPPSSIRSRPSSFGKASLRSFNQNNQPVNRDRQLNESSFSCCPDNTIVELMNSKDSKLNEGFVNTPATPGNLLGSINNKLISPVLPHGINNMGVPSRGEPSPQRAPPALSPRQQANYYLPSRTGAYRDTPAMNDSKYDDTCDTTGGIQYSCADVSEVLHTKTDSRLDCPDKDDSSTTTSGSYVVDPQDLCDEIDELFFKDLIV